MLPQPRHSGALASDLLMRCPRPWSGCAATRSHCCVRCSVRCSASVQLANQGPSSLVFLAQHESFYPAVSRSVAHPAAGRPRPPGLRRGVTERSCHDLCRALASRCRACLKARTCRLTGCVGGRRGGPLFGSHRGRGPLEARAVGHLGVILSRAVVVRPMLGLARWPQRQLASLRPGQLPLSA